MTTICLSLVISMVGQSEPASSDQAKLLEQQVQAWVLELDADEKQARVDAEKKLIELGGSVLEHLPVIDNTTSAETKDRLTRIRSTLEKQLAAKAAEATTITASGKMTLNEFFELVKKQTGNELVDFRNQFGQGDNDLEVELDVKNKPFFEVLDEVSDQVGLTVYNYGGQARKMMLVARSSEAPNRTTSAGYGGPFRFEATEIVARRSLRDQTNSLRVRVEALWEPRILPIVVSLPYGSFSAEGDNGEALALSTTEGVAQIPVQSTVTGIDLIVGLDLPDRSVAKIAKLKGQIVAMVPGREIDFEFDKLKGARNVIKKRAGVTVTLDRAAKIRMIHEFRIKLRLSENPAALQSHLDWASNNVIYLEDKDGKKVENPTFEQYLARENEVGFRYLFPLEDDIENYKLVYRTPAGMINLPVEFELKDIELP